MSVNTIDLSIESEGSSGAATPRWPEIQNSGSGGEEELSMAQQISEAFVPRVPECSDNDNIISSSDESESNDEFIPHDFIEMVRRLLYGIEETSSDDDEEFISGAVTAQPSSETATDDSSVDGNFACTAVVVANRILFGSLETSSDDDEELARSAVVANRPDETASIISSSQDISNEAVAGNSTSDGFSSSNGGDFDGRVVPPAELISSGSDTNGSIAELISSGSDTDGIDYTDSTDGTDGTDYTDDTGHAVAGGSTPNDTSSGMSSRRNISWVDTISANSISSGFQGTPASGELSLDITPPLDISDEIADRFGIESDALDSDDLSSELDSDDDAGSVVSVIERELTNSFLFLGIKKPKMQ